MNFYWFYNICIVAFIFTLIAIIWIPLQRKKKIKEELQYLERLLMTVTNALRNLEERHSTYMVEMRWTEARQTEDLIKRHHEYMAEKRMRIAYLKEQLDA